MLKTSQMKADAGLFLDRDGTIIEDLGYLCNPALVRLIPGADYAIKRASRYFNLYLVTNQSGIGRGYYTIEQARECNDRMIELVGVQSNIFKGICIAPEKPGEPSLYRKPSPRFVNEMIVRDGLDPSKCWMIGDKLSDIQCGINAGIKAAFIRGRYDAPEQALFFASHGVRKYTSLLSAVDAIITDA